ncbi:MAG: hybrid sensor histidine kinase/response regulator [Nostocales cyanobacterium]|nr:MAG: hybrid sensor histidine kinase/response regulator [Nostocales cyanobacterium]TAF18765.1 MAG: hybrid sensor histidine kinase/response regulator [Nostocales cyanobacterium]
MKDFFSILVVDDEPNNFDVIETFLYQENYQLFYAQNGQKAISSLAKFQPDVILMDVMMPEMDGLQACKLIKSNSLWQSVPIIIVTALTSKEDLAKCLAAGADDFISKPINALELRARINSMLRIKCHYDQLQELLKWQKDMLNMIVHDLRNYITGMTLSADLVLNYPQIGADKRQQKLSSIIKSGQDIQEIIDSLLVMSKLESRKMILNYLPTNIYHLCNSVLEEFTNIAETKKIQLINKTFDHNLIVSVDEPIFRRIIHNLIANAIKFSPSDSQIMISASQVNNNSVKVEIADFGSGIRKEIQTKIFEKYEIGDVAQNTNQIGLGLAFCKMAIEAHGGKITVRDNYPQGAVFTVEI